MTFDEINEPGTLSDTSASSVVFTMPVSGLPKGFDEIPFLATATASGKPKICVEVLKWTVASLSAGNVASLRKDLDVIQCFFDFCNVFTPSMTVPEEYLDYVIYAYLIWRQNGTLSHDGCSLLAPLRWRAQSALQLRKEFLTLSRFFRYCSATFGHMPFGHFSTATSSGSPARERLKSYHDLKDRDFFTHLSASREFWAQQLGTASPLVPPIARALSQNDRGTRTFMQEDEIWEIIRQERNPVFRALWLLAAFGGPRLSEMLNLWQIDVLPASYHLPFLGYEFNSAPLVLKANPMTSRYTSSISRPECTREEFFKMHFEGRYRPRPHYLPGNPLRAGWKSMGYVNNTLKISPVYWINLRAARLFDECAAELREFHRIHKTSRLHPWFFVNTADPGGEHRGLPTRISNVQKAWDRACHRCGLQPHHWNRTIHALRHYYKHKAQTELKIPPEYLQIMLGHRNLNSQRDYGRDSEGVHSSLVAAPQFSNEGL